MSKRYGRNQKRRAREEIARLSSENAKNSLRADNERSRNGDLSDFQRRVFNIVGELSVVNQVATMMRVNRDGDFEVSIGTRYGHIRSNPNSEVAYHTRREVMRLLEVRSIRDDIEGMLHASVRISGWKAGFAMSDTALQRMPIDILAEDISRQIAYQLVDAIRR
jgi:hypothetical protein